MLCVELGSQNLHCNFSLLGFPFKEMPGNSGTWYRVASTQAPGLMPCCWLSSHIPIGWSMSSNDKKYGENEDGKCGLNSLASSGTGKTEQGGLPRAKTPSSPDSALLPFLL